jgi:isocitrate lyase
MNAATLESTSLKQNLITSLGFCDNTLEPGKVFTETNTGAMLLPRDLNLGERIIQYFGSTLVPLNEAVQRLESASRRSFESTMKLKLFACTEARSAVSITETTDLRDRKYLTGMKTSDGYEVYCGGLDAAISRARVYACCADVLCYTSDVFDAWEAVQFATRIRSEFPEKQLGFGYSARFGLARRNGFEQKKLEHYLRRSGYEYFLDPLGSYSTVAELPHKTPWALLDDAARRPLSR